MSNAYRMVQWNRHKRVYDALVWTGIAAYLGCFVGVGKFVWRGERAIADPVLAMRALGTAALVLLHLILWIGPVARLTPRVAPLLYNRRHLGVSMFLLALSHAVLAVGYYGGFGGVNPLRAVLGAGSWRSISGFPFEILGFAALLILFGMAATSHDFWLANLSARAWKWLHMGVYGAYALLVMHVALGALQSEWHPVYSALLMVGVAVTATLHTITGFKEWVRDRRGVSAGLSARSAPAADGHEPRSGESFDEWVDVASVRDIPDTRAKVVCLRGRGRVAVFRNGDSFSAVSNVCAHQGGPLGEGKIVGGCITCPWHGYQYLAHNGQSPPPYTEKIPTYELRVRGDRIELNPTPRPPGTPIEPARITPRVPEVVR